MTKKKTLLLTFLIAVVVTCGFMLSGCGAGSYMDSADVSYDYADGAAPQEMPEEAYDMEEMGSRRTNGQVGQYATRHVIRTGSIELAVNDTRETMREIREMVNDLEGIVSYSYVYEIREGQFGGRMTVRVPERLFESTLQQLETYGKATNVQTGSDDVTMQYVDLEARLKNQEAQEERLAEILEMAETVEEVLEVEKELARVRGEIESMTTQMMYLSDQVTYATIEVGLREETISTEGISPGAFDNIGQRIQEAFIGSINFILRALSVIIVAIIALLPVLILVGIVVLVIVLIIRKARKGKNKPENSPSEASEPDKQ